MNDTRVYDDAHLLMLHSSAIAHRGATILFAGESGAGKSTIYRLLAAAGHPGYGDELAFCFQDPRGEWRLHAMASTRDGKVVTSFLDADVPIGLIVQLHRHLSSGFRIRPLDPMTAVHLGFRSAMDPWHSQPEGRVFRFRNFADLCRKVPTVELDFAPDAGCFDALLPYVKPAR